MARIEEQPRLIDRVALCNMLSNDRGLGITVLLSGQHGIGKSMIIKKAAKKLNGEMITIECSQIGEGVINGLPFAFKNPETGTSEVRFIKFSAFNKLYELQKHYFEIATTTGFLNGRLKMDAKTGVVSYVDENGKKEEFKVEDDIDRVIDGEDNEYKFGEKLPSKIRAELLSSGEIKPVFIFLDEINRADIMAQKECMNIILNRSVNGYDLPWWSEIVAAMNPVSQNSTYAVNEMDPAQLDRFLKIKVRANLDDWIEYALDKGLSPDIVSGLAVSNECFIDAKDKSLTDETEMTPSPRSWEMVSNLYETIHVYNKFEIKGTPVFTSEDQSEVDNDLRTLMIGKVGQVAAATILAAISNRENMIKPQEILTAKSPKIDPKVRNKFNSLKSLSKKCIADSVIRYIAEKVCDYEKGNRTGNQEARAAYFNFMRQIGEFVESLDLANKIAFVKKISLGNCIVAADGKDLYGHIAKCFAKETYQQVLEFRKNSKEVFNN